MGPDIAGMIALIGIVGGGWLMAIFMFRDVWGRFPWQPHPEIEKAQREKLDKDVKVASRCSGFDDPEDRCPRSPVNCMCWKPEVRDLIAKRKSP